MSTISFPDWINSLSPQSTDGKEVYQQDGSTPSRGDLDDKASLSGANFTDMPQVGGSPIVSRGSNSNGEWVRFANGTQIVSGTLSLSTSASSEVREYTLSVSNSFLGGYKAVSADVFPSAASYANRDRISWHTFRSGSLSGDTFVLAVKHGTSLGSNAFIDFVLIGNWK